MILIGKTTGTIISIAGLWAMAAPSFNLAEFGVTAAMLGVMMWIHHNSLGKIERVLTEYKAEIVRLSEKVGSLEREINKN